MKVWKPTKQEIENTKNWGIWSKEASVFPWSYDSTETCFILEGECEVEDKIGNKIHFTEGDMIQFEQGLECTWKIIRDIRKRYLFS